MYGKTILAVVVALAFAGSAQAALVTNGSFESPDLADGTNDISDATSHVWQGGWTSGDNAKSGYGAGVEDPSTDLTGQTGAQYAKMKFTSSGSNQWIKIYAPSQGSAQAAATYTLTVAHTWDKAYGGGQVPTWGGGYNEIKLQLSGNSFSKNLPTVTQKVFSDLSIEVVVAADGTLVSHTADSGPSIGTLLTGGTVEFNMMGGRAGGSGGSGDSYRLFDNARLVVDVIPEPATMGLLAFGGLGVLIRRRRK